MVPIALDPSHSPLPFSPPPPVRVFVVGLGMVGLAFIEKLLSFDEEARRYSIVTCGEEPFVAYNRVGLTGQFFLLSRAGWGVRCSRRMRLPWAGTDGVRGVQD